MSLPAPLAVLPPFAPRTSSRTLGDRSSGAVLLTARTGAILFAVFAVSVAIAQVAPPAAKASVAELLVKWTPLLARGFLFNLAISVGAMAFGTVAGLLLGFARLSLHRRRSGAPRGSWSSSSAMRPGSCCCSS